VTVDYSEALRFDPMEGQTIREAPGDGYGNWVGGKVSYDEASSQFVLFYRERRPLEQGRAGRCGVAVSEDGINFTDMWVATKEDFAANSIEEGHCVRVGQRWFLYVSYEVVGTSRWRIDLIEADGLPDFDAQTRRTVLEPSDFGLAWIKDPFVMFAGDELMLYAAVPARTGPQVDGAKVRARAMDATVVAVSGDGRYFPEIEYVFESPQDDSWHGRRARINSIIRAGGEYVAFFDGGRTFYDNYEEKAGLAISDDGKSFQRLASDHPWVSSDYGTVRYVCALRVRSKIHFYYEFTRPDGAHDLRMSAVDYPGG
jgi:hypothetical protein